MPFPSVNALSSVGGGCQVSVVFFLACLLPGLDGSPCRVVRLQHAGWRGLCCCWVFCGPALSVHGPPWHKQVSSPQVFWVASLLHLAAFNREAAEGPGAALAAQVGCREKITAKMLIFQQGSSPSKAALC